MAALERFGVPRRSFPDWCGPNAGGYVLDTRDWPEQHILHLVETVQYTKENG
jgi:alpha-ribazole phosphatase